MCKQTNTFRILVSGVLTLATLAVVGVLLGLLAGEIAYAGTPPPPPTYYTLTVGKNGGDDNCLIRILSPVYTGYSSEELQCSVLAGTTAEIDAAFGVYCPYVFESWLSNNPDLDGDGDMPEPFVVTEDTYAIAEYEPRMGTLTIFVDDPTPNSSDAHLYDDPGHTFWIFEGTCVPSELEEFACQKWGFYPTDAYDTNWGWKTWVTAAGDLRYDDEHSYTDAREYEISYSGLLAGLVYTKSLYDATHSQAPVINYHVENYNCTDAAITVAASAGVSLPNAYGECDCLGHTFAGDCPGVLGENLNP